MDIYFYEGRDKFSLIGCSLFRSPRLNLGSGGGVGHVSLISARLVIHVLGHPLVVDWSLLRGREVGFVMHPTKPFSRNHGSVVIQIVFFVVDDPSITTLKMKLITFQLRSKTAS